MKSEKMFTCENCDYDIEIEDIYNTDTTVCHNCGQEYQVAYIEEEESWELVPIEGVEEPTPNQEGEPFQVDVEPGALDEDEFTRY